MRKAYVDHDVREALAAFAAAPSLHAVRQREPARLFAATRELLHLAADRDPTEARLRASAIAFLRTALFEEGADHYAVLGLGASATSAQIKEHYRLVMRLVHPDFSSDECTWPPDAAARLNLAYDVLRHPKRREQYDLSIRTTPDTPRQIAPMRPPVKAGRRTRLHPHTLLRRLAWGFGTAGLGGLALLYWTVADDDGGRLVQRARLGESLLASQPQTTMPPSSEASGTGGTAETTRPNPGATPRAAAATPATTMASRALQVAPTPSARAMPVAQAIAAQDASPVQATIPLGRAQHQSDPLPVISTSFVTPSVRVATAVPVDARDAPSHAPAGPPAAMPAATTGAVGVKPTAATASESRVASLSIPKLADVQPLLSRLLQLLERGAPERIAPDIDPDTGASTGAAAFARQYAQVVGSGRPAKVLGVQLQSEPAAERLVVLGNVSVRYEDPQQGTRDWLFPIRAEFAMRRGIAVMTSIRNGA